MTTILQKAISDVQAGKYVELDICTAYNLICKTQSLGKDWKNFLENAPRAVLHTKFRPNFTVSNLRDYVLRELEMPTHEEKDLPLCIVRVKNSFDSATVYLQQYNIEVEGTKGKVFIWQTPTEIDFDRARAAALFVLEFFRQAAKGSIFEAHDPNSEVRVTTRGMEKFFDINIKSGINNEAWVGFDFR